jgi:hypothetical protein
MNSNVGIITRETPLRLETAAKLAFPDGSMKLAGLRREISRGRLGYEVIAGKHYTTLADIDAMRELCRVQVKVRTSGEGRPDTKTESSTRNPPGSSETESPKSPQDVLRTRLSKKLQSKRSAS